MNPIPAAAAVEPVTVLPRNVIAAQAARPEPGQDRQRDPAGDRRRLEQDRRVDPADDDGQDRGRGQDGRDRDDLGAEERAARRGLRQDERGGAAVLLRRHGPHRQDDRGERPELGQVLPELVDGVGGGGGRDDEDAELVAADGLEDLRAGTSRAAASSGRRTGTARRRPASRYVRHDSSSSLRSRIAEARPSRGPPDEAQEDVLERRPHPLERGEPHPVARRRSAGARPRRRPASRHRHDQPALGLGDAVDPGDRPKARRQRRDRRRLPGLGSRR